VRIGFGFDAHPLVEGRPLIIAGCRIPFERGLEGFSDADVAAHALIDALLGAGALGDCGTLFPAGDPRFAGADSLQLLGRSAEMLRDAGYEIGNVDCTIVAEQPALSQFVLEMRRNVARAAGIAMEECSVKAKRTEGLGFTGLGQGMAAYAVALIVRSERALR